jgi:hypothetical protein
MSNLKACIPNDQIVKRNKQQIHDNTVSCITLNDPSLESKDSIKNWKFGIRNLQNWIVSFEAVKADQTHNPPENCSPSSQNVNLKSKSLIRNQVLHNLIIRFWLSELPRNTLLRSIIFQNAIPQSLLRSRGSPFVPTKFTFTRGPLEEIA